VLLLKCVQHHNKTTAAKIVGLAGLKIFKILVTGRINVQAPQILPGVEKETFTAGEGTGERASERASQQASERAS